MQGSPKSLAARLRAVREQGKVSAREVDRLAGITSGHVSAIESGRRPRIEIRTAERIARVLGISLDWLVLGKGAAPRRVDIVAAVDRARAALEMPRTGTGG